MPLDVNCFGLHLGLTIGGKIIAQIDEWAVVSTG